MDDKRRRARVQGAWAAQPGKNLQGLCVGVDSRHRLVFILCSIMNSHFTCSVFFRNGWHLSDLVDGELRA